MRIFLTGSTGLLGINVVSAALARGHEVLALVRDEGKAKRVLPADNRVQLVQGDLENWRDWVDQLAETDALVHGAAYFREYYGLGNHTTKLKTLNVEVPVELARAADELGLKRTIMVSSSGVVEPRPDGKPADESDPANSPLKQNAYFMSKVEMERELARIRPTLRHQMVIVRPGWMFGPNDYAPTSAGQLVQDLLHRGALQLNSGTPMGVVDARDVAAGIIAALEVPNPAPVYHLAGHLMPGVEALREVARQAGTGKVQSIPTPVALMANSILEIPCRMLGMLNPIPRMGVLTLGRGVPISSERAKNELEVNFRPFEETARDTVQFHRSLQ